jgi:hypothetical protein
MFITAATTYQCTVFWAKETHSMSLPLVTLRCVSLLIIHLCLAVPSTYISSNILNKILYAFTFFLMCASYPTHITILHPTILLTSVGEYKLCNYVIFFQPYVASFFLVPNTLFSIQFSYFLSLCSFLNVESQISLHTEQQEKNHNFLYFQIQIRK